MHKLICIFAAITITLSSGCSHWPAHGRGGMAEHHPHLLSPVKHDEPLGPEHGLRFELELTSRHLDILVLEGAERCFPAAVLQARHRQARITRALHGGLQADAETDLVIQRHKLVQLEHRLDQAIAEYVCIVNEQNEPSRIEIVDRLRELLNSDNQFAFDSSKLNPKYVGRLADAAWLLRDQTHLHLRIIGHADTVGNTEHNKALSHARAVQVKRYLELLGLHPNRMEIVANGSTSPLFPGGEAHVRLTNRRVNIELIDTSASIQK